MDNEQTTVVRSSAELSIDDERIEWPVTVAIGHNIGFARSRREFDGGWNHGSWAAGTYSVTLRAAPAQTERPAPERIGTCAECKRRDEKLSTMGLCDYCRPTSGKKAPERKLADGWERASERICYGALDCDLCRAQSEYCKFVDDNRKRLDACEAHAAEVGVWADVKAGAYDPGQPKPACILCGASGPCDCVGTGARPRPRPYARTDDPKRAWSVEKPREWKAPIPDKDLMFWQYSENVGRASGIDSERPPERAAMKSRAIYDTRRWADPDDLPNRDVP